jgi:hypothetical protein
MILIILFVVLVIVGLFLYSSIASKTKEGAGGEKRVEGHIIMHKDSKDNQSTKDEGEEQKEDGGKEDDSNEETVEYYINKSQEELQSGKEEEALITIKNGLEIFPDNEVLKTRLSLIELER